MKNIAVVSTTLVLFLSFSFLQAQTSKPTTASNPSSMPTTSSSSNPSETFNLIYSEEIKSLKPEQYAYFTVKLISDTDNSLNDVPLAVYMLDKANDYFSRLKSSDGKNEIASYLGKKYVQFGQLYIKDNKFKEAKDCFSKANTLFVQTKNILQPVCQILTKQAELLSSLTDKPDDIEIAKKLFILYLVELNDKETALQYAKMSKFEIHNEIIHLLNKKEEISANNLSRDECKYLADFFKEQMVTAVDKSNCQINAVKYYQLLIDDMNKDKKKDANYLIVTKSLENIRKATTYTLITTVKDLKASDKIEQIKKLSKEEISKKEEIKKMLIGKWQQRPGCTVIFSSNGTVHHSFKFDGIWTIKEDATVEITWETGWTDIYYPPIDIKGTTVKNFHDGKNVETFVMTKVSP